MKIEKHPHSARPRPAHSLRDFGPTPRRRRPGPTCTACPAHSPTRSPRVALSQWRGRPSLAGGQGVSGKVTWAPGRQQWHAWHGGSGLDSPEGGSTGRWWKTTMASHGSSDSRGRGWRRRGLTAGEGEEWGEACPKRGGRWQRGGAHQKDGNGSSSGLSSGGSEALQAVNGGH
jgi:hypothetical protein